MNTSHDKLKELAEEMLPTYTEQLDTLWQLSNIQHKSIEDLEKLNPGFDRKEFTEMDQLNEIAALTTISLSDILVIAKALSGAKTDWEKLYFTKQAYLTLFETIKSYRTGNQSRLQQLIQSNYAEHFSDFATIREKLNAFALKYKYEGEMRTIRNTIAGHVESFREYYNVATTLNGQSLGDALAEFIPILYSLQQLLYNVIKTSNQQLSGRWDELQEKMQEIKKFLDEQGSTR